MNQLQPSSSSYSKTSQHAAKDMSKFENCVAVFGFGVEGSASHYRKLSWHFQTVNRFAFPAEPGDRVGVSVNGNRPGRVPGDSAQYRSFVDQMENLSVTIVTDDLYDRNRSYNIGERELAAYLTSQGWQDPKGLGLWTQFQSKDSLLDIMKALGLHYVVAERSPMHDTLTSPQEWNLAIKTEDNGADHPDYFKETVMFLSKKSFTVTSEGNTNQTFLSTPVDKNALEELHLVTAERLYEKILASSF